MQHLFLSTFCTVEAIECYLKPDSILTLSAIDYLRPEGFPQFRCQLYNLVLWSVLPTVFSCLFFALFCITLPCFLVPECAVCYHAFTDVPIVPFYVVLPHVASLPTVLSCFLFHCFVSRNKVWQRLNKFFCTVLYHVIKFANLSPSFLHCFVSRCVQGCQLYHLLAAS